jgi:hypothetical protein
MRGHREKNWEKNCGGKELIERGWKRKLFRPFFYEVTKR